ncbi:unnamed protein product [Tetraodon nigroviridis]|uniref:Protein-glutamine gamma-glutamyltransferase 2 n=1 Tax=Tetraodon nigroviridis TaxID=99883 RepID=Q4T5H8_TETNG|nr:unnamed protein product [Tetraodon nigroviridis]
MAEAATESVFKAVKLHCDSNNLEHHTSQASQDRLLVRRGQAFRLTLELSQAFNQHLHPLTITAATGPQPSETRGTLSRVRIPPLPASRPAKAAWKMDLDGSSSASRGVVPLAVTPPADAPVGEYSLTAAFREESCLLGRLTLLFNPWCPDDGVFLEDEEERAEYVMNEDGVIYKGSYNYISSTRWDYGQFEDSMVDICLKLLDMSHKHKQDPAKDASARRDPVYVGRVLSAMINSDDDHGVLEGRWSGHYFGGTLPSHWNGSHAILKKWYDSGCLPVKYGQCWVFAAVMCSAMRFLGIPCRLVTNFRSAHDTDGSLTVDEFYADYGVREKPSPDSVWNFHVWVEGWMRRPDLDADGTYDGWQVLDPTPQEKSGGVFCCGPASVEAIRRGQVGLRYDGAFVFAEVKPPLRRLAADGTRVKIWSDTKDVGKFISTKSVRSDRREDITSAYKPEEADELCVVGDQVTKPEKGKDVELKLVVTSKTTAALHLSINLSVQAMRHAGTPATNIQSQAKKHTLQPNSELSISVLVPFLSYTKAMLDCESMKVVAQVTEEQNPERAYLAKVDVVLLDPPISLTVSQVLSLADTFQTFLLCFHPAGCQGGDRPADLLLTSSV